MMNIELLPQLIFSFAAPLASVFIACAGVAFLLCPVFAVVRNATTQPSVIFLTGKLAAFGLPYSFAFSTAKFTPARFQPMRGASERLSALLADQVNLFVSWMVLPENIFRLPYTIANKTAKITFGFLEVTRRFHERFSAIVTSLFSKANALGIFSEILSGVYGCRAFIRAIDARPRFVILKFFSASGAIGNSFRSNALTLTRAMNFAFGIARWMVRKDFSALGTSRSFHFVSIKAHPFQQPVSLSRRRGPKGMHMKQKQLVTASPRYIHCNTFGGNYGRT